MFYAILYILTGCFVLYGHLLQVTKYLCIYLQSPSIVTMIAFPLFGILRKGLVRDSFSKDFGYDIREFSRRWNR